MEEQIKKLLDPKLRNLKMFVDGVVLEQENNNLFLRICLDSTEIIDLEKIVEATKVINPIIDQVDIIDQQYILEVFGKSKGSELNEKK